MSKAKGFKKLDCKICGEEVPRVDEKADRVTCWRCVQKLVSGSIDRDEITINDKKEEQ